MQISLLIVMLAALLVPILMARFKINAIPTAVAEILIGMVIGTSGFQFVHSNESLTLLSTLGVIILMFLSGMEIDFSLFKKSPSEATTIKPMSLATRAFGVNVLLAGLIGIIMQRSGIIKDGFFIMIVLTTIAMGVVIATLKEKEILSRPIGQTLLLTAVLGEIFPMVMITIYGSLNGGDLAGIWLTVIPLLVAILLLKRFRQPYLWFSEMTKATTQLDIRLAFFLIFTLVLVAEQVGAENILGAFLAGMVMKLLEPTEVTMDKLTSIGYGFFIPIFFIMTGVKFDLWGLVQSPTALKLVPLLVGSLIIAKLGSILVFKTAFGWRNAAAGGILTVTTITLVLPALEVAKSLHTITQVQADAFTLAALIVCLIAPITFNTVFKLRPADQVKERVVLVGANILTVPIAQKLSRDFYDVRMVTNSAEKYQVYNSEFRELTLMPELTVENLQGAGYLDADVIVFGVKDQINAQLALASRPLTTARIIASFQDPATVAEVTPKLRAAQVEILNSYHVNATVMRELIESPSILQMLENNDSGLYEVQVRNHRYAGVPLMGLPLINHMTISRIRRGKQWLAPHGQTPIEYGDRIIFTADHHEDVQEIRRLLGREN
ncbi:cation:proton antiporter family protein [Limosilactobacillus equigenerosi]|uniref:Na-H antiporter n=1 Tax=Limosilactobacillus equigenerosi DSM 18793 = JCM 14505 TaxID=1423742 RepID=A0A0R1UNC1_9LACO|nr:cation:proton antiporter family protein [Limosilactobacillus equigenerosi]KRL94654.1 Na-H antiporter [Limosilactobacillus equigenerosi DSM 18793 = JCM 14505]